MGAEYGSMTSHAVGIIMKEAVRRAIVVIQREQFIFEAFIKDNPHKDIDHVTTADKAAQKIYVKMFQECFPNFGIIAEEGEEGGYQHLFIPCRKKADGKYFTLDALDGTNAFVRRQSHGIGTMVALVNVSDGEIESAYVGDVMSREIYGYRPGSKNVWRISDFEHFEQLTIKTDICLSERYALLRGSVHDEWVRDIVGLSWDIGAKKFRDYEIEGGSIGMSFARLWKSEVAALVIPAHYETPWDLYPALGISKKLGFVFFTKENGAFREYQHPIQTEIFMRDVPIIAIHRNYVPDLIA